jgi:regulator of sigma E protease
LTENAKQNKMISMNLDLLWQYPLGFLLGLVAFVAIFIPAVCIHEFGHLIIARLCGVRVPEYAVGMPFSKRTFFVRKFGIVWSFYPILLGGFVRLFGDNDALDHAHETNRTDPKAAKEEYRISRLEEILSTNTLQFFLQDNGLEYDSQWQQLENYKPKTDQPTPDNILKLQKQLQTLIDWELEKELQATDTFFSKNWIKQTLIILGGITFNFTTAILCYATIFGFALGGSMPLPISEIKNFEQRANIKSVSEYANFVALKGGVAEKNDIITGDKLYSIGGKKITDFSSTSELSDYLQTKKSENVEIIYSKKGSDQIQTKSVKLEEMEGRVLFGIQGDLLRDVKYESKGPIQSLNFGFDSTKNITELNFTFLGKIGQALLPQTEDRSALKYLGGPVGTSNKIVDLFKKLSSDQWISAYLQILASISVSLAVFNLLPIPALDGGRWLIITLTKLLGRRNRKIEGIVIGYSFIAMMLLGVGIMFKDGWEIIFKVK